MRLGPLLAALVAAGAAMGLVVAQTRNARPILHEDLPALTGDKAQPTIGKQAPGANPSAISVGDKTLVSLIAHELAHNVLRHRARLDAAGVDRGLMKQFGRNARLFRQTEVEADRLSVWLLAGAGYDPGAAVRFWTAFGQREGRPLFQAGTHPRWQDRVEALASERGVAEIDLPLVEEAIEIGKQLMAAALAEREGMDSGPLNDVGKLSAMVQKRVQ